MFKKKAGLAFKPKIPTARPKPVNAPAPKTVDSQPTIGPPIDKASNDAPNVAECLVQPSTASFSESQTVAHAPPPPAQSTQATTEKHPPPGVPSESELGPRRNQAPETEHASSGSNASGDGAASQPGHSLQPAPDNESPTTRAANQEKTAPPLCPPQDLNEAADDGPASREPIVGTTSQSAPHAGAESSSAASATVPPAISTAPEPVKKSAKRKNKLAAAPNGSNNGEEEPTPPPKRQRKKASKQEGGAAPRPRTRKSKENSANDENGSAETKKSRKGRSPTPEDAENQQVDLQQLKMADLTKDLRIGKKFSRHDELRDRERMARVKAKLLNEGLTVDDETSGSASPAPVKLGAQAKVPTSDPSSSSAPAPASGPQFRIVDGQIVLDQSSLFMDRHARAAAAQAGENMETIEENDFTRLITSSSFSTSSKLKGPNIWTDEETELFYRGLRMFGTEFEMISKMFPGKQRRHVKLKFNREERHNPKRIDAALIGEKTIKLDIDEYRAFTGAEFESVETIEAEQRKIQEAYEQERQRIADEQAEIMRKKREELFADDDGDETAAGRKKKGGKKKDRQAVAYGLNGEPITQDD